MSHGGMCLGKSGKDRCTETLHLAGFPGRGGALGNCGFSDLGRAHARIAPPASMREALRARCAWRQSLGTPTGAPRAPTEIRPDPTTRGARGEGENHCAIIRLRPYTFSPARGCPSTGSGPWPSKCSGVELVETASGPRAPILSDLSGVAPPRRLPLALATHHITKA